MDTKPRELYLLFRAYEVRVILTHLNELKVVLTHLNEVRVVLTHLNELKVDQDFMSWLFIIFLKFTSGSFPH